MPCYVQKTLCLRSHPLPLALTIFYPLFRNDCWALGKEGVIENFHLGLSTPQSQILCISASCGPLLHDLSQKKLLWWQLRDVFIHEYQSLGVGSILCVFSRIIVWSPQEGDHRVPCCDYSALYRAQRAHLWSLGICLQTSPRRRSSALMMLRGGSTRMWCWTKLTAKSTLPRHVWDPRTSSPGRTPRHT